MSAEVPEGGSAPSSGGLPKDLIKRKDVEEALRAEQGPSSGGLPKDLIKRKDVEKALQAEHGPQATIRSYVIKDFTSKGDNYNCVVTSVIVQYDKKGSSHESSYVVKLNPRGSEGFNAEFLFFKEIGFYNEILPLIDEELGKINEPKLRTPKCFNYVAKESEEVIYLEDLRRSGFRMLDRQKNMDPAHVDLILQELARLHAGSVLLMAREEFSCVDMIERFPFLNEAFDPNTTGSNRNAVFLQSIENSVKIAETSPGYEFAANFLRKKKACALEDFMIQVAPKDPFRVICHGDCWNNNFLFRYGHDGAPVECRLLDLQVVRIGSPALDLNYMFYCSLDSDVRTQNLDRFFDSYYSTFARALATAGQPIKFSLDQIRKEFYSKNLFGLFMGMFLVPFSMMDADDAVSFGDFDGDDVKQKLKDFEEKVLNSARKNPKWKNRLLDMFDEMRESGLFST